MIIITNSVIQLINLINCQIALVSSYFSGCTPMPSNFGATPFDSFRPPTLFHDFLKWYEKCQASNSTTSVVRIDTSFTSITHSTYLSFWIFDLAVTNHIFGNKCPLSSLTSYGFLSFIIMANGSPGPFQGVDAIHFLLFSPLTLSIMSLGLCLIYRSLVVSPASLFLP